MVSSNHGTFHNRVCCTSRFWCKPGLFDLFGGGMVMVHIKTVSEDTKAAAATF